MNRPLLIDPQVFGAATEGMAMVEVGVLLKLAMHFWECGELPIGTTALSKLVNLNPKAMDKLRPKLTPFFAPGGFFPILREASLAKAERRARAGRLGGRNRWAGAGAHARMLP